MKWWCVFLLVFLMPIAVQAQEDGEPSVEIGIEGLQEDWPAKGEGWEYPVFTILGVEAKESLHDISIHIEFSTPGHQGDHRHPDKAGRCEIFLIKTNDHAMPQMFPTRNGDDFDLWVPYFDEGSGFAVVLWWEVTGDAIWTASMMVRSEEDAITGSWENEIVRYQNNRVYTKKHPKWLGTEEYPMKTILLGAVCDQLNVSGIQPQAF